MNYTFEDKIAFRKKDKQSLIQTFINCWAMIYEGKGKEPNLKTIFKWVKEVEDEIQKQVDKEMELEKTNLEIQNEREMLTEFEETIRKAKDARSYTKKEN